MKNSWCLRHQGGSRNRGNDWVTTMDGFFFFPSLTNQDTLATSPSSAQTCALHHTFVSMWLAWIYKATVGDIRQS